MWEIFQFIIVVILILVIACCLLEPHTSSKKVQRRAPARTRTRSIEDCISTEDLQYQLSKDNKRVVDRIEASEKRIRKALNEASGSINLSWINSYKNVIRVSSNLDENIARHTKKNLEYSRFQYYTSLWFRSMLAADFAYKDYKEVGSNIKALYQLRRNGRRSNVSISDIDETINNLKELKDVLLDRVNTLNQNTGMLRDKIVRECGKQGEDWGDKIMQNRLRRSHGD